MKKFLLPLAVAIGIASTSCGVAAAQWTAKNQAGGAIVLTDSPCVVDGVDYPELRSAFTFTDDATIFGCWASHPGEPVYVVGWITPAGVEVHIYPADGFKRTSAAAAGAAPDRLI